MIKNLMRDMVDSSLGIISIFRKYSNQTYQKAHLNSDELIALADAPENMKLEDLIILSLLSQQLTRDMKMPFGGGESQDL